MKYITLSALVVLLVVACAIGGYYFVFRPIQESAARKACGSQANKEVFTDYGYYGSPYNRGQTYDLSYRSCLNSRGF